jgi:predicted permease
MALEIFEKLLPVFLPFIIGMVLRRAKIFGETEADTLLHFTFYVSVPALSIVAISHLDIDNRLWGLPAAAAVTFFLTLFAAFQLNKRTALSRETRGTVVLGSVIMNTSFVFPFVLALLGEEAFVEALLFDFGNGLLIYTVVYYIACAHGETARKPTEVAIKVLRAPALWAMVLGFYLGITNTALPQPLATALRTLGDTTIPLIMVALGLHFKLQLRDLSLVRQVLLVRMAGGFLAGFVLALIFGAEPRTAAVVAACAAAPCGYNTLVYSSLAKLDLSLAAGLVSVSLLCGLVLTPLILLYGMR